MKNLKIKNNEVESQFETVIDGKTALIRYKKQDDATLELYHTEVPAEFEGKGVGSQLVKGALEQIKNSGQKIVPSCPFIATYVKRHSEYQSLVK